MPYRSALKQFGLSELPIEKILAVAQESGGDFAELFFEEVQSTRVIYESGRIDRLIRGQDRGVGLRILFDQRCIYGYTTDLTESALLSLAQNLSQGVTSEKKSPQKAIHWTSQQAASTPIAHYQIQKPPHGNPLSSFIEQAERAAQAAHHELPHAKQITSLVLHSHRKILIFNSQGKIASDSKTYMKCMVQVVAAQDARVETAAILEGGYVGLELFDQHPPESIGQRAARRVKTLLTAKPAPSGCMPVVLSSEAGGTMIHEAVGHGLEADLACHGLSVYQDKIGQQVAASHITVIDDGTLPEKQGSYCIDDEGHPSQKTTLIHQGILQSYLVDQLSALKFGLQPTGNGRRESFRDKPIVRMTNTYIAPGAEDPEQILKDTTWGIFVKAMGGGQVNTVTGDFVFAVTEGYLIHQGQLGAPIRGATLVGNGPQVLQTIDRMGHDLGFAIGTCGKDGQAAPVTDAQPTLRIPSLTVGGEVPLETYWESQPT